ncbi:uncharacterized protein RAG0_17892 [Rhynchosporium agropyri]|uniref:Uncharacterized protein n=1 Tax=Rhynchosporium agropyri TaxID=914238 RepID=A0A1E1LU44_9HELO|nr:uncharacterized protein RAG0_17892 [Rhynchosporium agropyri]
MNCKSKSSPYSKEDIPSTSYRLVALPRNNPKICSFRFINYTNRDNNSKLKYRKSITITPRSRVKYKITKEFINRKRTSTKESFLKNYLLKDIKAKRALKKDNSDIESESEVEILNIKSIRLRLSLKKRDRSNSISRASARLYSSRTPSKDRKYYTKYRIKR